MYVLTGLDVCREEILHFVLQVARGGEKKLSKKKVILVA